MNFFGGTFFSGGFFGEITTKTGTGGIDPPRRRPTIYKPTGLLERKKEGRKGVEQRIEETREIHEEIKREIALSFREETHVEAKRIELMTSTEVDKEIAILLKKKLRTEEEEMMMILMMLND